MQAMRDAVSHFNYGLMRRGLLTMEIFMTTTAALLAGALLLLITFCLGRLTDKRSSRKVRQSPNGMRQLMQQKKLHTSKIYFMNLVLIAHAVSL